VSAQTTFDPADANGATTRSLEFDDNGLVIQLFGSHNSHLARIEQRLEVAIHTRGNELTVVGAPDAVEIACAGLNGLYARLKRGLNVGRDEVDAAVRMSEGNGGKVSDGDEVVVRTRKRHISPRSTTQAAYLSAIDDFELVFALGPAGTGKTYLAVAKAVECMMHGEVDRIILSRPALEAGEQLGFLPGDLREKVDPYLRPLYDALHDMLPGNVVAKRLEKGEIEVAPLAFMRGRTLSNAFVILDEAQNTTAVQMKMILTRLGENSRMVVTGDLTQVDLPRGIRSGLRDAVETLEGIEGISFIRFGKADVVRHSLVTRMVDAYEEVEARRHAAARYEKDNHDEGS
jgi:phosphate starvation-inducible protein PhoH and related proteins